MLIRSSGSDLHVLILTLIVALHLKAYAAARMTESILRGLEGEENVYEAAYVESSVTELPYFATKVKLGPTGVTEILPLGDLSAAEKKGVEDLIPVLKGNIDKGVGFAKNPPKKE